MSSYRRIIILVLLGFVAVFVQGTLLHSLFPHIIAPNFLMILNVFLAFYEVTITGAVISFIYGLQYDLYSGVLLGPWAGAFVVIFGVLASLSQRLFVEAGLAAFILVCVSSVIGNLIYLILIFEFRPFPQDVWFQIISEAVLTGVFAPVLMHLMRRLFSERARGVGSALMRATR